MKPSIILKWVLAASCMPLVALASQRSSDPIPPAYKQECSSCHVAYPRSALPAVSWQRLMSNLNHHFGTDASIDDAQVKQISAWLVAGASTRLEAPPEDRVTRSTWFVHEHGEVPPPVWKRASIKSASNCAACHTRADQGDFSEHNVRIPR